MTGSAGYAGSLPSPGRAHRVEAALRLYLVTDPAFADLPRIAAAAVAGGVTCVQVRDKDDHDRLAASALAVRRAVPSSVPVLANDDLAVARTVDGVHVGVDDVSPGEARRVLGDRAIVGWSINAVEQLDDLDSLAACDYVAASPVWPTPTKTDTSAPFGLDGVRTLAERLRRAAQAGGNARPVPLIGIGGISAATAESVVAAGAAGVAVVSAVGAASDPAAAARMIRAEVDRALDHRSGLGVSR